MFFRGKIQNEEGYILYVRKNALQILIPKYGLESTLYVEKKNSDVKFEFSEEVCKIYMITIIYYGHSICVSTKVC